MTGNSPAPIRIAAAVITDAFGRILLVKKRNTSVFLQPGGKLEQGETPEQTLARELREELGCGLQKADFLGNFSAPAANEPPRLVEAILYSAEISGEVKPAGEIEEMIWLDPRQTSGVPLAPLSGEHILPFILSLRARAAS